MAAGGAAVVAIVNAMNAAGVCVRLAPEEFEKILRLLERPLVVHAEGGLFSTKYQYLAAYKGFVFYTKSSTALPLPNGTELVKANKIWVPS
jgi:hypothetical protein